MSYSINVVIIKSYIHRYFVDDTRALGDHMTVELLYLQSRLAVVKVLPNTHNACTSRKHTPNHTHTHPTTHTPPTHTPNHPHTHRVIF